MPEVLPFKCCEINRITEDRKESRKLFLYEHLKQFFTRQTTIEYTEFRSESYNKNAMIFILFYNVIDLKITNILN